MKPQEAFILSRINGMEPVRSVFALSPLTEEQTARCSDISRWAFWSCERATYTDSP